MFLVILRWQSMSPASPGSVGHIAIAHGRNDHEASSEIAATASTSTGIPHDP